MLAIISMLLKSVLFVKSTSMCLTATEGLVPLGGWGARAHAEPLAVCGLYDG